jgi:hypothetical protein
MPVIGNDDKWHISNTVEKFRNLHPCGFPCNCSFCKIRRVQPSATSGSYSVNLVGDVVGSNPSLERLRSATDFRDARFLAGGELLSPLYVTPASTNHAAAEQSWCRTLKQKLFCPWDTKTFHGIRPGQKPTVSPDEMMKHVRQIAGQSSK